MYCAVLAVGVAQNAVAQSASANLGSSWSSSVSAPAASVSVPAAAAAAIAPRVQAPAHAIMSGAVRLPQKKDSKSKGRVLPFSKLAIGTKESTLGLGGEIATPLARGLNLRAGVNLMNFDYGTGIDGANYQGEMHLKNGQASLDWFPFKGGFHISPGVVVFKSVLSASVFVPGGGAFSLGSNNFTSSASDPIMGNAKMVFTRSILPAVTIGFGNMIPGEHKHWSAPFEVGAAYTGHYGVQLNLQGTACSGPVCRSTSSPLIQPNVVQEQNDLNEVMKHYQLYPIITSGLAFRF
jgi:hypothetical protein